MKIMKLIEIQCQNHETHENLIIQLQNHENHEILRIPCQMYKKYEKLIIWSPE